MTDLVAIMAWAKEHAMEAVEEGRVDEAMSTLARCLESAIDWEAPDVAAQLKTLIERLQIGERLSSDR